MSRYTPMKKLYSVLYSDLKTTVQNGRNATLLWRIRRITDEIEDREDRIGRTLTDNEIRRIIRVHIRRLEKCLKLCAADDFEESRKTLNYQLTYLKIFFDTENDYHVHSIITATFANMQLSLTEFKYPYIVRLALWATKDRLSPEAVSRYIADYYKHRVLPRKV